VERNAFPAIVAVSLLWLLAALSVACTSPADDLAVDACVLAEIVEDCTDRDTNEVDAQCAMTAKLQATRIKAGIPPQCRGQV
jgi:hypothetical protein